MKMNCNVHLIPTDQKSRITYLTKKGRQFNDLRFLDVECPIILDSENFHLHISIPCSDNIEMSGGDLYIDDIGLIRTSVTSDKGYWSCRGDYGKIIASTDKTLKLPIIPDKFIKSFVNHYNLGEIIKNVELEKGFNSDRENMKFFEKFKFISFEIGEKERGITIINNNDKCKIDLSPLKNLIDEGYDPYNDFHHLQLQRWLHVIEKFVENIEKNNLL